MSVLRDLAMILLALEAAVAVLAVLAALALVNYGLFYVRWWHTIPHYFSVAWKYLNAGIYYVKRTCQIIAAPVFAVARFQSTLVGMVRGLLETMNNDST